jgi:hypothetical protein
MRVTEEIVCRASKPGNVGSVLQSTAILDVQFLTSRGSSVLQNILHKPANVERLTVRFFTFVDARAPVNYDSVECSL